MIEAAIRAILEDDEAVSAIIKSADATPTNIARIAGPDPIPMDWDYPAAWIGREIADREGGLDGALAIVKSKIDVACWAYSYPALKTFAAAVRKALNYKRGEYGGVLVELISLPPGSEEEGNDLVEEGGDQDTGVREYWIKFTFDGAYHESTS